MDLTKLTFSRRGSYLFVGAFKRKSGRLVIGTASDLPLIDTERQGPPRDYYEIACFADGVERPCRVTATPEEVTLDAEGGGRVRLTFLDDDTLIFDLHGVDLVLLPCHSVVGLCRYSGQHFDLPDYRGFTTQQLRCSAGASLQAEPAPTVEGIEGPYGDVAYRLTVVTRGASCVAALRLHPRGTAWREALPAYADALRAHAARWQTWLAALPAVPVHLRPAAEAAWYLLWSNIARSQGLFQREPLLVSNYWFNRVYAWDNCFHALGVAAADPELAVSQLLVLYDHQSPSGAVPDPLSDQRAHFAFIKPPVHGWAVLELLSIVGEEALRPHFSALYRGLEGFTRWWFELRDANHNGLAEYVRGCDSGWDNATPFDVKVPVDGADLGAHLVLQMEALARLATLLGRPDDAARWTARSREHLDLLLRLAWRGNRFVSLGVGGERAAGDSLLDRIPLELGARLPAEVRRALLHDLRDGGDFLGAHGFATESVRSPAFKPRGGYWRGPIWAPSTCLLVSGLDHAGEAALARTVRERFCAMVARDSVFWENYDPLTGDGLDSPGMGWTASVFLRFAHQLATR